MILGMALRALALIGLHMTLRVGLGLGAFAPDLLTLAVLVTARRVGLPAATLVGLGAGLLVDSLNELSFGAAAFALSVIGALGSASRDYFVGDSRVFVVLYVVLGVAARDALAWLVTSPELRGSVVQALLLQGSLDALYVALVALVLWPILMPAAPEWKGV
jgi:rod shape-determining protein MreD